MDLKNHNILFFTRTMRLGGTENVILQMCEVLKPHVNKIVVCSCGGINVKKLSKLGIRHYEIPDIDSKAPNVVLKVFSEIPRIIEDENISIVHTHHRMATFYMYFINKRYHLKLVSTLHGTFSDKKMLTRMVYRQISIVACGKIVKERFVETYNINENHITIVSNAIRQDRTELEELACLKSVPKNYKRVGYIGRLSPEKGVQVLIEAINLVVKRNSKIVFIIVGSGDLEFELREAAKKAEIEKFVHFLGYREDAQNVIRQMDAVVLPSFTEGLPLTPIEAFAQGKPIVATAAGGTVEIVDDGINGFLVPIGDKVALAEGILKLFKDQTTYDRMSEEASRTYEEKFSFEKFEVEILKFYVTMCEDER